MMYSADQLRMVDLLKDPVFKKHFLKPPATHDRYEARGHRGYVVWVQRVEGGPWGKRRFRTYKKAFEFIKPHVGKVWDFAIVTPGQGFRPPLYKRKVMRKTKGGKRVPFLVTQYWDNYPVSHEWCMYCRRPTVFKIFRTHHAWNDQAEWLKEPHIVQGQRRCTICGAGFELAAWRPPLAEDDD